MSSIDREFLQHAPFRPLDVFRPWHRSRPGINQALNGWRARESEISIVVKFGEIGASPASEKGGGAFEVGV